MSKSKAKPSSRKKSASMASNRVLAVASKATKKSASKRTAPVEPSPPLTRKATLFALLSRTEGAALTELVAATHWQVHSVRAALTHFRHAGHAVHRRCDAEGVSRYHIAEA